MRPPEPLNSQHDLSRFNSGNSVQKAWLVERAVKNQEDGATRTFVVCNEMLVVGYYALALGQVNRADAPGAITRGMPDPVPMMVLARLAVDQSCQSLGLGRNLVRDAVERTLRVSMDAGVRGLLVSAIDDKARAFYEKLGFVSSRADPNVLMMRLKTAAAAMGIKP